MAYNLKQSTRDVIVGSRPYVVAREFEVFSSKLRASGAELIFVFKKTKVNSPDFIKEMEESDKNSRLLTQALSADGNLDKAVRDFNKKRNFEFPVNQAVMLVLSHVAMKYGTLKGMDTIQNHAATFNVHLANKYNAMAILGLNAS